MFFFQAEDGIRDFCLSRGLGDVYKRQHKDRKLLTGDSPFAANALGKLAAQEMLAAYAG